MELTGLFLLLLLPPADATGETAAAVEASLRGELGEVAMAIAPDTLVTPAMLQGEKPPIRARFVARLTWKGKDKAAIEVVSSAEADGGKGLRITRDLRFSPMDRKPERGRSIGLVVAGLLREIPAAALLLKPPPDPVAIAAPPPTSFALGGLFALERPGAGKWAMGPALFYDFRLAETLRLRATGNAFVADGFLDIGAGADLRWRFLHSTGDRHGLAAGGGIIVFRESMSIPGEHGSSKSQWTPGLAANLSAHATLWRSLRVVGQIELRAAARALSLTYGESPRRTMTFSLWRPVLGVGLEYAL